VCCLLSGACGGSTSVNNTYFASTDADTSPCSFSVCKLSDSVCSIRLDFDTFNIAAPNTAVVSSDALPHGRTQCQHAWMSVSAGGGSPPTICGTNTGYHMLVEPSDSCATVTFQWTSSSTRSWDIKISQVVGPTIKQGRGISINSKVVFCI